MSTNIRIFDEHIECRCGNYISIKDNINELDLVAEDNDSCTLDNEKVICSLCKIEHTFTVHARVSVIINNRIIRSEIPAVIHEDMYGLQLEESFFNDLSLDDIVDNLHDGLYNTRTTNYEIKDFIVKAIYPIQNHPGQMNLFDLVQRRE